MRKLAVVLGCLILVSALPLEKSAFSGTYSIKGVDPGVGPYTGMVTITLRREIYDVLWVMGAVRYGGVGVVSGDTLSVAYAAADYSFMGVMSYTPRPNGLDGKWAVYGGKPKTGSETATRK